ncbi:hypothetical protein ERO13_A06G038100v2 [Gossypium hirsutum]|uniref:Bifunctional inhibitor/plant lipid transfer protein/seed storage helical domain-containing protein n=3 Tax=Gossypium TaxID=3633 RepID=A0A2P5Y0S0_GOSBA|nr:non-specific lipid transfer protein GPI-anchored 31-like [Gossypium hirsutum]KAB2076483.1 hypothetical protein ES319_A06G043600v1 [Gossypium barbadense]KAG4194187.1 hypothetical protein ERO13_A06G038100v2 [Gossypium hirsutum]PPS09183.1 hypothetical protein GOBAR_AA11463 [Gossypium barbadense]TYH12180.1 hypothetical protein ES288_A06G045700v1 [Gossypium darwinii]
MEKIYVVICIFMTSLVLAKSRLAPPASPSLSCSTAMYNMVDCVQFLSNNGSKDGKPAASCCAGLEKVLKSNPDCICEYIKNNAQLGANINVTKAETLPSACQISAPPISQCDVSPSPGVAPASPSSDKGGTPSTKSPSTPPGGVPPPSHHSGAYSLPAWFFASISILAVSISSMVL